MSDENTYGFSKHDAEALIQGIGIGESTFLEIKRRAVTPDLTVILDAALAVATNSKTGATSGLATICEWDSSSSDFVETSPAVQITVYNHSESTAHAIDTFGVARWIGGHWWFFGDCAAMASR